MPRLTRYHLQLSRANAYYAACGEEMKTRTSMPSGEEADERRLRRVIAIERRNAAAKL